MPASVSDEISDSRSATASSWSSWGRQAGLHPTEAGLPLTLRSRTSGRTQPHASRRPVIVRSRRLRHPPETLAHRAMRCCAHGAVRALRRPKTTGRRSPASAARSASGPSSTPSSRAAPDAITVSTWGVNQPTGTSAGPSDAAEPGWSGASVSAAMVTETPPGLMPGQQQAPVLPGARMGKGPATTEARREPRVGLRAPPPKGDCHGLDAQRPGPPHPPRPRLPRRRHRNRERHAHRRRAERARVHDRLRLVTSSNRRRMPTDVVEQRHVNSGTSPTKAPPP
jgi:hypothetical protein